MTFENVEHLGQAIDGLKKRAVACAVGLSEENRKEYLKKVEYYLEGLDYYLAYVELNFIYNR